MLCTLLGILVIAVGILVFFGWLLLGVWVGGDIAAHFNLDEHLCVVLCWTSPALIFFAYLTGQAICHHK